jgi:hypothetical protein
VNVGAVSVERGGLAARGRNELDDRLEASAETTINSSDTFDEPPVLQPAKEPLDLFCR